MAANPFIVFPWQRPFLADLKDFLIRAGDGYAGRCLLITPNRRPWRYLLPLFSRDKNTGLLPKMLTISELVEAWGARLESSPLRVANVFDQVALLHDVTIRLARDDLSLPRKLAKMDMEQFLPWGLRLAAILEEFAIENVSPTDLCDFDGELSDMAASILQALGRINKGFIEGLSARGWTSMGRIHQELCAKVGHIPLPFTPSPDRPIAIAGFYRLSGSHEIILKSLWQAGAHVCIHSDPALASGQTPHWACAQHKKWGARTILATPMSDAALARRPEMGFFSGYDFHSQLEELSRLLGAEKHDTGSTAIILGKSDTLLPTLHQLADRKLNISMGYPLERTYIADLLNLLLDIQENRIAPGRYHSRDILRLLDHPALGLLSTPVFSDRRRTLSALLRDEQASIAERGKIWEMPDDMPDNGEDLPLLATFFQLFVTNAENISCLAQLATYLGKICAFLIKNGGREMAAKYPLEAEAMSRLHEGLFPLLRDSALAQSSFSIKALHGIFSQALGQIRIPFEADPMLGLQVIGMLESRLLHFDRVLILDATDDILPGSQANDPLMPDFLKSIIGLPDNRTRDESAAHNLYRLCAGARKVDFLWQEGTGHSDFYDSKKVRSRYVEQFIWEMERNHPELLAAPASHRLVRKPVASLKILRRQIQPLLRTKALDAAINAYLQKPVAISHLDDYLYCPRAFILKNIMRLDANDAAAHVSDNPHAVVGTLVHAVLGDLFSQIGPEIRGGEGWAKTVQKDLEAACRRQEAHLGIDRILPVDKMLILQSTVPARIMDYLKKLQGPISILGIEKPFSGSIQLPDRTVSLKGRADRLDVRDGAIWIIDYKTGRHIHDNDAGLWMDDDFFRRAEKTMRKSPGAPPETDFAELLDRLTSIQLAAYLVLLSQSNYCSDGKYRPGNAAWAYLREKNPEIALLDGAGMANMQAVLANCASALGIILAQLAHGMEFGVADEGRCASCRWKRHCAQR